MALQQSEPPRAVAAFVPANGSPRHSSHALDQVANASSLSSLVASFIVSLCVHSLPWHEFLSSPFAPCIVRTLAFEVVFTGAWTDWIGRLNCYETPAILLQPAPCFIFFIKVAHNISCNRKHHCA